MVSENIAIFLSVIVVLSTILVFFITNSFKKIDNIVRIEETLKQSIKNLDKITQKVENIFTQSVSNNQEIIRLKERLDYIEKKIEGL